MARKTKQIPQRNGFKIITNGKRSEKNYFKAVKELNRTFFDLTVKFCNADPAGLLDIALKEKKNSNHVWIVFDKDEFPAETIYNTMRQAKKNDIGVAFSNAAFEVWLLDHFVEFNQEKTADELVDKLDLVLKEDGYNKGYKKNDSEVFSNRFMPRIEDAVHNAKVSLQRRKVDYNLLRPNDRNYPYCDWNSCTTVHELVEALKLEGKN